MAASTEFLLLGPLVVQADGTPVTVPAAKQRAILAGLLLRANHVVTVDELAEMLWAADLPSEARVGVQNYVMRLRRALGPAGSRITTQPRGYLIRVETGELDLDRFEDLLRDARAAFREARWPDAATQAAAALALWRGEPLADAGSDLLVAREGPRLTELRLQALEMRLDSDLHTGRHGEVIGELRQLAAAQPLRERFHGLLMLALYRDGRRAEALAAYQHARDVLVEELGAEPGPDLQRLHLQIMAADPDLVLSATAVSAGKTAAPVPRELPGDVAAFTGRTAELAELDRLLLGPRRKARTASVTAAAIWAVSGTAGVGKTALAVHWAHLAAEQFPDGQLYVNLRGYDPDQPVAAADALAGFLRALGVAGKDIPVETGERAARYRSLLAGKRAVIVLDNASGVEQVRPLLPGTPGCAVVVTSRDSLAGLVARDGAARLDLDVLPLPDAAELLRQLIGSRADADPAAVEELATQCCRLPLALRVVAELAAAHPASMLQDLLGELADQQRRLDLLDAGGDPRTAVRAVFSWSYQHLDADTARSFRLAGLHPCRDLEPYAVAALTGATLTQATRSLAALARAHLAERAAEGRYGMHDLLRTYARELAASTDGEQQEHAALTGLFNYYLAAACAAMDILYPAEARLRPPIPLAAVVVPEMAGDAEARAWLDRERANMVAVVAHCAGRGWPRHATGLADTLHRYLITGSHLPEAHAIYRHALHAARQLADLAAEARAMLALGSIALYKGQFRDASADYRIALERYRQCGDRTGEARALGNLGIAEQQLHNHHLAVGYYREAIAASEDAGDSLSAARALTHLAFVETELDSYDQAAEHLQRALPVFREANDQDYEAVTLEAIGELHRRRGQLNQAADFFEQALTINRRTGNPTGVADQLLNLGNVSVRQGEHQQAIDYFRQALAMHRQAGYQHGEVQTLRSLAEALHKVGQPAAARAELAAALRLAAETGNVYQQAGVHRDLAESHHLADEHDQARDHWRQALTLYTQLGAPEAEEIRARLGSSGEHAVADS